MKTVTLENALDALIDYRGKTPKKTNSGVPLVTAKIIKNGFILDPNEFIAESDYDTWMRRGIPKTGDVVLTTEAPLGEVAVIKNPSIALAQRVVTLRGKEGVLNNLYLKYFFMSPTGKEKLTERSSGTTVLGIKQSELRKIELVLPDIHIQEKIASVLSSYDDLIENNNRRIKILEEMAQRIYTEWFVRLRLPGSKKTYRNNSFPEGWEMQRLTEVISVNPTYKTSSQESFRKVTMDRLSNESMIIDTHDLQSYTKMTGSRFQNRDVLFARITPCLENGKTSYVAFLNNDEIAFGSTEFVVLRGDKVPSTFVYCLSRDKDFRSAAQKTMTGASGRQRVPADFFENYKVLVPTKKLLDLFQDVTENYFQKIEVLRKRNEVLKKTRDLLIPQLVTGTLKVKV